MVSDRNRGQEKNKEGIIELEALCSTGNSRFIEGDAMAARLGSTAIREIRTLLDWGAMGSWTDRQLLAHLPAGGEVSEAALRVLISDTRRWSWGSAAGCSVTRPRPKMHSRPRSSSSSRKPTRCGGHEMITNWMYGVALRTAKKERAKTARRQDRRAASRRPAVGMAERGARKGRAEVCHRRRAWPFVRSDIVCPSFSAISRVSGTRKSHKG